MTTVKSPQGFPSDLQLFPGMPIPIALFEWVESKNKGSRDKVFPEQH